jgi:integrase
MKTRYKNVTIAADRHGKLRARFRKAGLAPVYLKHLPDQPGFDAEYKALLVGESAQPAVRAIPGSVNALCPRYYASGDFKAKGGDDYRKARRSLIESFRADFGNDLVANFTFEHIEAILFARSEKRTLDNGRTVGGQVAARNLRKALLRLFAFAKKLKWIADNPVAEAEKIGVSRIKGFHTWSEAEIAQYQAKHPLGTMARLALEIILWTGQRRSDARLFGPQHIVGTQAGFRASKGQNDLILTVARDLRIAIDAMPRVGIKTFLITDYGKPFTKDGFGNKFRTWCDEAGLPHCSAHGLRKAIGRRMAQTKLTDEQMMSVGGWKSTSQLRVYTAAVEQEELASGAMQQIDERYSNDSET